MNDLNDLAADYPAMKTARAEIGAIASSLTEEHQRLSRDMAEFLDGDWTGPAADAFRSHFGEWTEGAGALLTGLGNMASLIEATMELFDQRDGTINQDLDRYVERLGLI
ncbi:MAG: WXG100 family type VII secretion target [Nocardioides sp.]|nr:WXG100 family type VII secretion target [Nocardioides sp.]